MTTCKKPKVKKKAKGKVRCLTPSKKRPKGPRLDKKKRPGRHRGKKR
jgi:hypothetical protein